MNNNSPDELAEAALWLLAQLEPDVQRRVRRRFALKLKPPESPSARYRRELLVVGRLLRNLDPGAGLTAPILPRAVYDEWRSQRTPATIGSSSSASLVARYGSWSVVCYRAYNLLAQVGGGNPWTPSTKGRLPKYTPADMAAALSWCAEELGRAPSWNDYRYWSAIARRRTRAARFPHPRLVTLFYRELGGWCAALEAAGVIEPPAVTVRVWLSLRSENRDLVTALRRSGFVAAPPGQRSSTEVYAAMNRVLEAVKRWACRAASDRIVLWEPSTRSLETLAGQATSNTVPRPARLPHSR